MVIAIVLIAGADSFKGVETWSCGRVGVDVNYLAALYVLEKSHRRVTSVILHHVSILLTIAHIKRGVLEDASLAISTLRRMIKEIFAN